LGRAYLEEDAYIFLFDVRYPTTLTAEELVQRCQSHISDKWRVELVSHRPPLYVDPESPLIRCLLQVYTAHTGKSAQPLTTGGATYARAIPNAVAFGPRFPGRPDVAHQRDESWPLEDFFRCTQIYAHAMYELANTL
ncbi:MAG: M20/M25/M40 family metallo-hydrolase, partial [Alicyclobacillus sp.]|nr:M20/M25/M40 family metallo-hydrolase [Alicyclobacillus sp.]